MSTSFFAGARLRWVKRIVLWTENDNNIGRVIKVLQQGLQPTSGGPVQWFDVPTEDDLEPSKATKEAP